MRDGAARRSNSDLPLAASFTAASCFSSGTPRPDSRRTDEGTQRSDVASGK